MNVIGVNQSSIEIEEKRRAFHDCRAMRDRNGAGAAVKTLAFRQNAGSKT